MKQTSSITRSMAQAQEDISVVRQLKHETTAHRVVNYFRGRGFDVVAVLRILRNED